MIYLCWICSPPVVYLSIHLHHSDILLQRPFINQYVHGYFNLSDTYTSVNKWTSSERVWRGLPTRVWVDGHYLLYEVLLVPPVSECRNFLQKCMKRAYVDVLRSRLLAAAAAAVCSAVSEPRVRRLSPKSSASEHVRGLERFSSSPTDMERFDFLVNSRLLPPAGTADGSASPARAAVNFGAIV